MAHTQPVRGFLCYAHGDQTRVDRIRRLLSERLAIAKGGPIDLWWDDLVLVGQLWDDEIRRAIRETDFALIAVSPAALASDYIKRVELPAMHTASGAAILPVGLQRVDFARADLQGLDAHQIFLYGPERKWFADLAGENRARFCDALAAEIIDRLA